MILEHLQRTSQGGKGSGYSLGSVQGTVKVQSQAEEGTGVLDYLRHHPTEGKVLNSFERPERLEIKPIIN